jgi:hypothetical protein
MEFNHYMPFNADFDLEGLGARSIYPAAQVSALCPPPTMTTSNSVFSMASHLRLRLRHCGRSLPA